MLASSSFSSASGSSQNSEVRSLILYERNPYAAEDLLGLSQNNVKESEYSGCVRLNELNAHTNLSSEEKSNSIEQIRLIVNKIKGNDLGSTVNLDSSENNRTLKHSESVLNHSCINFNSARILTAKDDKDQISLPQKFKTSNFEENLAENSHKKNSKMDFKENDSASLATSIVSPFFGSFYNNYFKKTALLI
ncbi:hypothetical protein AYI68_g3494 [Smittium mucronatum]|uniref:Uncharacterized protein n=1 Tax=Smittium mucronatum TaxID=133383 RepID=A0A1R0GZT2_9FUNG|nr:hypothetical protein AYI68_g3494 [Smittium mucronatum]